MCRYSKILDDLALHAATLARHPGNAGARQAIWRVLQDYKTAQVQNQAEMRQANLLAAVEEAEMKARSVPGYRADLDG